WCMASFFCFSSRRRHTRCYRDWSSDVCSSDLAEARRRGRRQTRDQSLLQVKAGQADMDIEGLPATATASLGQQYGVNKGRFYVGSTSCVNYMAMNNARAPFDNVNLRKAVEYAIDRPAQVRLLGAYAGKRTA